MKGKGQGKKPFSAKSGQKSWTKKPAGHGKVRNGN